MGRDLEVISIGFAKVLERFLEISLISFSYYFVYTVGKDLGRDLEGIWTDLGMIFATFVNDFGGHVGMILLLLSILFQYSFQIMRSLCQEYAKPMSVFFCEADVKTNSR